MLPWIFQTNGSLNYPTFDASDPEVPPIWVPGFFGDTVLVNGKVWPFLEVEPRKYRFPHPELFQCPLLPHEAGPE